MGTLRFHDVENIRMESFNHLNAEYDLCFEYKSRGLNNPGAPLPPWINVTFEQAFGVALSFRSMKVEAISRQEI